MNETENLHNRLAASLAAEDAAILAAREERADFLAELERLQQAILHDLAGGMAVVPRTEEPE